MIPPDDPMQIIPFGRLSFRATTMQGNTQRSSWGKREGNPSVTRLCWDP